MEYYNLILGLLCLLTSIMVLASMFICINHFCNRRENNNIDFE